MKHLKILGLLVVAAASLMAFASSASATSILTDEPGHALAVNSEIKSSAVETLTLKASVFTATCTVSEVNGKISTNDTTHAAGEITKLHFTSCDSVVKTLANGSLTINDTGEVFAIGNEVTVEKFGTSCIYGGAASPGTKIGTLTAGKTATLTIAASLPKKTGSGALCAANATWTGKYSVTTPDQLLLT